MTIWEEEVADTRMIIHAVNFSNMHNRIIACSGDTDGLVILLGYYSCRMLSELVCMHDGHSGEYTNRHRFIPIMPVAEILASRVCLSFPVTHTITQQTKPQHLYHPQRMM